MTDDTELPEEPAEYPDSPDGVDGQDNMLDDIFPDRDVEEANDDEEMLGLDNNDDFDEGDVLSGEEN